MKAKLLIKKTSLEYTRLYNKTIFKIYSIINKLKEEITEKEISNNLLKAKLKVLFTNYPKREFKVSLEKICMDQLQDKENKKTFLIDNVCARGKSKVIIKNGMACLNTWSLDSDQEKAISEYYIQEEVIVDVAFNDENNKIAERIQTIEKRVHGKWVSLLSPCNNNYMHFISETLPTLNKTICEKSNFGILLDWDTPNSCIEAISLLSDNSPIKFIARGEGVRIEKLIVSKEISISFWWPRKNNGLRGQYSFDKESLLNIRNKILSYYKIEPSKNYNLFIPRNSAFRGMLNEIELKDFLRLQTSLEEKYIGESLKSQVILFSSINILLTQAGALLANIMFMPKGSKVICLIADSAYVDYEYFYQYAQIFGVELFYLKCYVPNSEFYKEEFIADELHPMNASYNVSINHLKKILNEHGL